MLFSLVNVCINYEKIEESFLLEFDHITCEIF